MYSIHCSDVKKLNLVCVYGGGESDCHGICVWKSEDSIGDLVLSIHHVGSRHRTQIIRLGLKPPLSCIAGPHVLFCVYFCS